MNMRITFMDMKYHADQIDSVEFGCHPGLYEYFQAPYCGKMYAARFSCSQCAGPSMTAAVNKELADKIADFKTKHAYPPM